VQEHLDSRFPEAAVVSTFELDSGTTLLEMLEALEKLVFFFLDIKHILTQIPDPPWSPEIKVFYQLLC
jgi:hypothetical protein